MKGSALFNLYVKDPELGNYGSSISFDTPSNFSPVEWIDEELTDFIPHDHMFNVAVYSKARVSILVEAVGKPSLEIRFNSPENRSRSYLPSQVFLNRNKELFVSTELDAALKKEIKVDPSMFGSAVGLYSKYFNFSKPKPNPYNMYTVSVTEAWMNNPSDPPQVAAGHPANVYNTTILPIPEEVLEDTVDFLDDTEEQ